RRGQLGLALDSAGLQELNAALSSWGEKIGRPPSRKSSGSRVTADASRNPEQAPRHGGQLVAQIIMAFLTRAVGLPANDDDVDLVAGLEGQLREVDCTALINPGSYLIGVHISRSDP
ncbi:MAG TPA: hypothetical protein VIJ02_07790, partial [Thermoanaerobaculia bacterium]